MSVETAPATAGTGTPGVGRAVVHRLLLTLGPIVIALAIAGLILLAVGVDPLT